MVVETITRISLESIPNAFRSIIRNKRRSLAMFSGLTLGTSLIVGIFLFNSALSVDSLESTLGFTPYDAKFYYQVNTDALTESFEELDKIKSIVNDNPITDDAQIIGALSPEYRSFTEENHIHVSFNGENSFDGRLLNPIFVENSFFNSVISLGQITGENYQGNPDDFGSSTIVIPAEVAVANNLQINDEISSIFFTNYLSSDQLNETVSNYKIVGIYQRIGGMGFTDLSGFNVFFPIQALEENSLVGVIDKLSAGASLDSDGIFVGAKLDKDQIQISNLENYRISINEYRIELVGVINLETTQVIRSSTEVSQVLFFVEILQIVILIAYIIVTIPVFILSLYLINFGLNLSLEERRREIAIRKVQGASARQIFGSLRDDSLLLLLISLAVGYILGIIFAWLADTTTGFLIFNNASDITRFLKFDLTSFLISSIFLFLFVLLIVYRKGQTYIREEVTEGISKSNEKKESDISRLNIDKVLFVLGLLGLIPVILTGFNVSLAGYEILVAISALISPIGLWLGGALIGAKFVRFIPIKLEKGWLNLPVFLDVKQIIRSGLRRRGDSDKLSIIIILCLAITSLTLVQGYTEEAQAVRNLEWRVASDAKVDFLEFGNYEDNLTSFSQINSVTGYGTAQNGRFNIGQDPITASAYENQKALADIKDGTPGINWLETSFDGISAEEALEILAQNENYVFVNSEFLSEYTKEVEDTLVISFEASYANNTAPGLGRIIQLEEYTFTIKGTYNELPGAMGSSRDILLSETLYKKLTAIGSSENEGQFLATTYFLDLDDSLMNNIPEILDLKNQVFNELAPASSSYYWEDLSNLSTRESGYGISGLITLCFLTVLFSALVSTFSFVAVFIERRRSEFATLRAIGASKSQIYKLALGENSLMIISSAFWGALTGIAMAYMINWIFGFISFFSSLLSGSISIISRPVAIPYLELAIIVVALIIGMIISTMLSLRSAANQDLSIATRVV